MKDFFTEFRNDHRQIRDLIMNLIRAFIQNDILKAEKLLFILNEIAGPHFQFEEEVLYPELIPVYGPEYINKLYIDHDLVIARVIKLKELISKSKLSPEELDKGLRLLEGLFPHLTDCEGLSIMVETLNEKTIQHITKNMEDTRKKNNNLLLWANSERDRNILKIE